MEQNPLQAVLSARAELETLTPLKTNCGRVCGGACCQDDDTGENGMLLFPGEEALCSQPMEGFAFHLVRDDTLYQGGWRLVCRGQCQRQHRPLACRLFPLRVRMEENRAVAELDPRAWAVCPLLEQGGLRAMSRDFIAAVERAGAILMQNDQTRQALENEQLLLDEMRRL